MSRQEHSDDWGIDLEEEWMDDMRRLFEVFESFIPRFTIPNPELRSPRIPWEICLLVIAQITLFPFTAYPTEEHISFGEDVLPTLKTMAVYFRMSTCISQFCAMFSRCSPSFTLSCVQLWLYTNAGDWDPSTDAWNQLDDTLFILPPHTRVEIDVDKRVLTPGRIFFIRF
ncbi:hypothetical protein ABKN59_011749 [Abortiporus biennis]